MIDCGDCESSDWIIGVAGEYEHIIIFEHIYPSPQIYHVNIKKNQEIVVKQLGFVLVQRDMMGVYIHTKVYACI